MVKFMYQNNNHSSLPHHYLSGTFTPVSEETLPPPISSSKATFLSSASECLNGEFVRVGPNPKFTLFDGDGVQPGLRVKHNRGVIMVHGLRIKDGKATYVSRYVRTSKLQQEEILEVLNFLRYTNLKGLFGLITVIMQMLREKLKVLDVSYGTGTGNTALIYHHGKLLALQEADKPYVLKVLEDGDLQTLGMLDYDKRLAHSFTAHPKVDPFTGEMFTFGYSTSPPYITYRVISKDGFMHDPEMVTENKLILKFDTTKKARFGVLPRYAKDELQIRWLSFQVASSSIMLMLGRRRMKLF
ncbi:hypothetical protein RGQ29_032498 [Quercus rubra]|uniref:carotenoid 9,10-dioxygenase n=1 Tax=Quercus rubra TaxID=3512 RepID=A0AAN7I640_QUERU|nr:hypothetical protein RGQ29_032498 [Quercus rubra]